MGVKLLFEDGNETPSSILLKHCGYGNNIYFSDGSSNLFNKLKEIYEEADNIIVFFDVPPNNKLAVKSYYNFIDIVKRELPYYKNISVIPIICIEYYICKFLRAYDYLYTKNTVVSEMVKYAVVDFRYEEILKVLPLNNKKARQTIEKVYKYIIANLELPCMRNEFKYLPNTKIRDNKKMWGAFYEKDCNCYQVTYAEGYNYRQIHCDIKCTDELRLKAERLYCLLPVFVVNDSNSVFIKEMGIRLKHVGIQDVISKMQIFFNEICDTMGEPKIYVREL